MSGGSLDYAYLKVEEAADHIDGRGTPLYCAFANHLRAVAKALHDLEWVLSGDYGPGDEEAAIRAVIPPNAVLEAALGQADKAQVALAKAIADVRAATQH